MEVNAWGNLEAFIKDNENRVFYLWVYKHMFTPYEVENKFMDESQFDDVAAKRCLLRECVQLGNGDYLLGCQLVTEACDLEDGPAYLEYHKLSEIKLSYRQDAEKEFYEA